MCLRMRGTIMSGSIPGTCLLYEHNPIFFKISYFNILKNKAQGGGGVTGGLLLIDVSMSPALP